MDWFVRLHWLDREVRQLHGLVAALQEYIGDLQGARLTVEEPSSDEWLLAYV